MGVSDTCSFVWIPVFSRLLGQDKMRRGVICGADLNGDNLLIYRAYLWISNYCSVILRLGWGLGLGIWLGLGLVLGVALTLELLIVVCIYTAGKSDKMRINHVIKTDQWRSAPQIHPAPHFVVSPVLSVNSWSSISTIGPGQLQTCPLESDETTHYLFCADWCSLSRNNCVWKS